MFALAVRNYGLEESPAAGFQWTRSRRATSRDQLLSARRSTAPRRARRLRAGRRDLDHRRLHRAARQRASQPPLALRRLRRLARSRRTWLHRRGRGTVAEVLQGPLGSVDAAGGRGARGSPPSRLLRCRRRPRVRPRRRQVDRPLGSVPAVQGRAARGWTQGAEIPRPPPRSARWPCAHFRSPTCRRGWATPTSPRRGSTSITRRSPTRPSVSARSWTSSSVLSCRSGRQPDLTSTLTRAPRRSLGSPPCVWGAFGEPHPA